MFYLRRRRLELLTGRSDRRTKLLHGLAQDSGTVGGVPRGEKFRDRWAAAKATPGDTGHRKNSNRSGDDRYGQAGASDAQCRVESVRFVSDVRAESGRDAGADGRVVDAWSEVPSWQAQRCGAQGCEADSFLFRERMVLGQGQDALFYEKAMQLERRASGGPVDGTDVQSSSLQGFNLLGGMHLMEDWPDPGTVADAPEEVPSRRHQGEGLVTDVERVVARANRRIKSQTQEGVSAANQRAGLVDQPRPMVSEDDLTVIAPEQGVTKLSLEVLDLLRQARLRQSHAVGGTTKVKLLGDQDEGAQCSDVGCGRLY